MEVVVTNGAISRAKLKSNHHHQQTDIQFFFTGRRCLSCRPINSVKALKGKISHFKLIWGLPTLSLTINSSWLPWGRVAMPLISLLTPVPRLIVTDADK